MPDDFAEANVSQHVAIIRVAADGTQDFLHRLILSPYFQSFIFDEQTGAGRGGLPKNRMDRIPVALPPLAEQRRIVEKVDELMALCDRLAAAQAEREERRDQLAAAALARLNQPADDAASFRDHTRFALDHLPRLTTRPEHVAQLRQSILNLAVRGKLVPQDPTDEPAIQLLVRVFREVTQYAKTHKLPAPTLEPIDGSAVPYGLPVGWHWTRLCALFRVVTDGDHLPPPKADSGVAFLTIGNISTGTISFANCRFVPADYMNSLADYKKPAVGDILYTVVGATYGRPVRVKVNREFCVQRHIAILRPATELDTAFLCLVLASPLVYDQATRCITGTAQPTVALRPLRRFLIPLPPLAEQRRIVARVDELMAVCDQLDAHLTAARADRGRLLDAVLHDALHAG